MAIDPLKEYVRNCISLGYTRQQVRDRLLEAGYSMPEADSALSDDEIQFSPVPQQTPVHQFFMITAIAAFVLVAVGALLYMQVVTPQATDEPSLEPIFNPTRPSQASGTTEFPDAPNAPIPELPARYGWPQRPAPVQVDPLPQTTLCTSFSCMAQASQACTPSQLRYTAMLDFQNLTAQTTQVITLAPDADPNKCKVWMHTLSQDIIFYEEYAIELAALGFNAKQINDLELQANREALRYLPALTQCSVSKAALSSLFNAWSQGIYSTGLLRQANCEFLY